MFGLFKKKNPAEVLKKKYQKLMEESYKVSHSDRKKADALAAEAEEVMKEIEALKQE